MNFTAEDLAKQLGGGKAVRSGKNWNTVCPAHDDKGPSLSITEKDGRVLFKCHAGCSQVAVIDALKSRGLWAEAQPHKDWTIQKVAKKGVSPNIKPTHQSFGIASNTWVYKNPEGELVGMVHRFDLGQGKKAIVPQVWGRDTDGKEDWVWKSFAKPRPLYRAEYLKEKPSARVLVVEGEKTADAAAKLLDDLVVVTWPGGGNAVKFANWDCLKDKDVIIWEDADEPGAKARDLVAEMLVAVGAKTIKTVTLPKNLAKGWDLADPLPTGLVPKDIVDAATLYTRMADNAVGHYNQRFAYAIVGDKTVVIEEYDELDENVGSRKLIRFMAPAAFHEYHRNHKVQDGKTFRPATKVWADSADRRSYDQISFRPGQVTGKSNYNLWRGFTHEQNEWGDYSILAEHILHNIAGGDQENADWIFGWFAQMFQQPMFKPGTSLALRGPMGTGKTIVGKIFGSLFRDHYMLVSNAKHVTGSFNMHLAQVLLLHADEAFWAGDPRNVGLLRDLVTNDEQIIEPKGKDVFKVGNYIRLLVSSNNDWVMPTGFEERRFATFDMGEDKMQNRRYFEAMLRQMSDGGYGKLLHDLLHFDLTTTNVAVIPKTDALLKQKIHSLEPHIVYWYQCLLDGTIGSMSDSWPPWVNADVFYAGYVDVCKKVNIGRNLFKEPFYNKLLGHVWSRDLMVRIRKPDTIVTYQGEMKSGMATGYTLPTLETCRKIFEDALQEKIKWPAAVAVATEDVSHSDIPF